MKLFEVPEKEQTWLKCKNCFYSERHRCNSKIIWYCGLIKSKRTSNGQLKIKAKKLACNYFKPE